VDELRVYLFVFCSSAGTVIALFVCGLFVWAFFPILHLVVVLLFCSGFLCLAMLIIRFCSCQLAYIASHWIELKSNRRTAGKYD
jgi:hypothetical protein